MIPNPSGIASPSNNVSTTISIVMTKATHWVTLRFRKNVFTVQSILVSQLLPTDTIHHQQSST